MACNFPSLSNLSLQPNKPSELSDDANRADAVGATRTVWPLGEIASDRTWAWVAPDGQPQLTDFRQDYVDGVLCVQAIKQSGNCLFHSLAFLLPRPTILPPNGSTWKLRDVHDCIDGYKLRELVLSSMLDPDEAHWWASPLNIHPDQFDESLIKRDARGNEDGLTVSDAEFVRRYVKHMIENRGVWGGNVEIDAAAEFLHAQIVVLGLQDLTKKTYTEHVDHVHVIKHSYPSRKNPDGTLVVPYEPLTMEEIRSIPTYIIMVHKVVNRETGKVTNVDHYDAVYFKANMMELHQNAKEYDVDKISKAAGGRATLQRNQAACEQRKFLIPNETFRELTKEEDLDRINSMSKCEKCDMLRKQGIQVNEDKVDEETLTALLYSMLPE